MTDRHQEELIQTLYQDYLDQSYEAQLLFLRSRLESRPGMISCLCQSVILS